MKTFQQHLDNATKRVYTEAMTDMTVANTILQQLGGGRFLTMTGAKNLIGDRNRLIFMVPKGRSKDGKAVNKVVITLDPSDTYTVQTFYIRSGNATPVGSESDIYADQLQASFTRLTGLYTHL